MELPRTELLLLGIISTILSMFTGTYQATVTGLSSHVLRGFINDSLNYQHSYDSTNSASLLSFILGLITSILYLFSIVGCLIASSLADRLGRRPVLFLCNNVVVLAGCISILGSKWTNLWQLLLLGRAFYGINYGMAFSVLPLYLTECSSVRFRGLLGGLHAPVSGVVSFIAALLSTNNFMGTKDLWHWLLALNGIPAVVQIIAYFFVPESPQYEYLHRQNGQSAMETIKKYIDTDQGDQDHDSIETILNDYRTQQLNNEKQLSFVKLLRTSVFWPTISLAIVIGASRGFTGESVLGNYTGDVLVSTGVSKEIADYVGVAIHLASSLFAILGCVLVEYWGRRPLLLNTLGYIACSWSLVAILQFLSKSEETTWISWISICLIVSTNVIAYPIGCSGVTYFISAEICAQSIRATVASFSIIGGTLNFFIIGLVFPLLNAWSFSATLLILFVVPLILTEIFLYFRLPETKNRPIVDIIYDVKLRAGRRSNKQIPYSVEDKADSTLRPTTYGSVERT